MVDSEKYAEHIKAIINSIPTERLSIEKIIGNGYFNGLVVVKNLKLAGRLENIKFLESVEPSLRSQFLIEGKILGAMQHKNIPRMYDIIDHDDVLLFRTEHITGYTLREVMDYFIDKHMPFPRFAAASMMLKLINALYYAHNDVRYENRRMSIIHCDIKPSNIILCAKNYQIKNKVDKEFIRLLMNNKIEPYIVDFGIARFKGRTDGESGTLQYMSPSQLGKNQEIDWRTDIYQLFLLYYELLAQKAPYAGFSRNRIIREKSKKDFSIGKDSDIARPIKDLIEKGTKRRNKHFGEKYFVKELSKIESMQKRREIFSRYKRPAIAAAIIMAVIIISFISYNSWDYNIHSTDAMLRDLEKNPNASLSDLESSLSRIQERAFEKKYYEPLLNGEFRDKSTGKPLYPSHLDANKDWVLVGPETEDAGAFVGLLFNYSDKYPKLKQYAIEYAEPILESEFDGSSEKRFMYALIPAYEHTQDEKYLKKLINVTDTLIDQFSIDLSTTECNEMSQEKLFLFAYNHTGDKRYLDFYNNLTINFIDNNIDSDGYIYSSVTISSSNDSISYDKWGKLVTPIDTNPIGNYIGFSNMSEQNFKNVASILSRDYIEVMLTIKNMYKINNHWINNNSYYVSIIGKTYSYYLEKTPDDNIDYLFISNISAENNIPRDTLAAVKSLYLFKNYDNESYRKKLQSLLSPNYFRSEKEKGILSGSVWIENERYDNTDLTMRNQSLIVTDALFLELR